MGRIFRVCEECGGTGKTKLAIFGSGQTPLVVGEPECEYCDGIGEIDLEDVEIPETVYLQFWTDREANEEVTWCRDQIEQTDIEYKRVRSHVYRVG